MHEHGPEQVLRSLTTRPEGLSASEARTRLAEHGPNALPEVRGGWWRLLIRQFQDVLVYVLFAALALSIAMPFFEEGPVTASAFLDAGVIGFILVANSVLGMAQEWRAERAVSALQALSAPRVRVRRDGEEREIPSRELVPGDVMVVEAGDRVAADARLLTASHVSVDESALTGESEPVDKSVEPVPEDAPVADRSDMLHAGTGLVRGSAEAVVTATGVDTQTGRIAHLVGTARSAEGPLQRQLRTIGQLLAAVAVAMVVVVVAVGLLRAIPVMEILLVGVSLAVSAVPEGLPAVVTVCFALGARRMSERKALVRRLDALETLGAVSTIITDKTGTLTTNRMVVAEHWLAPGADLETLARVGASCSHATWPDLGDPTELALLGFARDHAVDRLDIDEEEVPFTSERKWMRTRHGSLGFLKGAPERLLELATVDDPTAATEAAAAMADRGRRVLAAAIDEGEGPRLVGLYGLEDPPREGVAEAIAEARAAGIRTIMVTGDHVGTARAIARRVGLDDTALEGRELDGLDASDLADHLDRTGVFARVAPHHKVALCQALQDRGEVIAMTGDGVNDAPALKTAHVGVAMGERGTQVAREAADIVLADDHYATIVRAVREGRRIHDNIRRFVLFLLQANAKELLLILVTLAAGWPLPFLPIHVLWLNLLTDGAPALALAYEDAEPDVMERPPRDPRRNLLHGLWGRLGLATVLGFAASFAIYGMLLAAGLPDETIQTGTVVTMVTFELLLAFSARSDLPIWRVGLLGNRWMLGAIALVIVVQAVALFTPARALLHFTVLPAWTWGPILLAGLAAVAGLELQKYATRHRHTEAGP